jgi:alkyl hydroperoxide reductase subunit AhpC
MGVLVGRSAPDFTAAAVTGSGEIVENFNLAKAKKQLSSFTLWISPLSVHQN